MADANLGQAEGEVVIKTSSLGTVQSNLRNAGGAFTAFGDALVGGFGAAVNASADFETQISIVRAVSGDAGESIDALREKALELGRKGPFGPTEVAAAFAELSKAGLTATEIIDGAGESVIALAKAGDISVPRAAEILANTMRTFNIEASKTPEVIDLLAGAANQSTLEIDDLAVSLKYAGGIAEGLGIPLDDVATALAQLGNAGIKGSTGGTSLRQMLLQLNPTSKVAQAELEKLGLITKDGANLFFTAEGKAKSLSDIFQILKDHTSDLTDQERIHSLGIIFGNRAAAAAAILSRDGAAGFEEMSAAIGKVSAADVAATKLDNLNGSIRKMKAAFETALIGEGSPFQDGLRTVVDWITKAILAFDRLPGPVKKVLGILTVLTGVLAVLGGGALITLASLVSVVNSVSKLPATFSQISSGFKLLSSGFQKLSATLLTNPIFLIVVALIVLGIALYELYQHNETFRKFVDNLWQTIQVVWDKILGFFKKLPEYFTEAWDAVKNAFSDGIDWIKRNWDILLAIFTGPIGAIVLIIRRFGDDIVNGFKSAGEAIQDFFNRVLGAVASGAVTAFIAVVDFFQKLPGRVLEGINGALVAIGEFAIAMPERILYAIGFVIGAVIRFAYEFIKWHVEMGQKALQAIVDFVTAAPGIILAFFTAVVTAAAQWALDMITQAINMGANFLQNVINFFQQLPGWIISFLTAAINAAIQWGKDMIATAFGMGYQFLLSVADFFSKLPGTILQFLAESLLKVWEFASNVIQSIRDLGQKVLDAIWEFFSQLPGRIVEAVGDLFGLGVQLGLDLLRGIAKGLADVPGVVGGAVKSAGKSIVGGIADGLGINSPSRYTREHGRGLLEGLRLGLQDDLGVTVSASKKTAGNVLKPIDQMFSNFQAASLSLSGGVGSLTGALSPAASVTGTGFIPSRDSGGIKIDSESLKAVLGSIVTNTAPTIGELTINNPTGLTTEESMTSSLQKLAYMGVLP